MCWLKCKYFVAQLAEESELTWETSINVVDKKDIFYLLSGILKFRVHLMYPGCIFKYFLLIDVYISCYFIRYQALAFSQVKILGNQKSGIGLHYQNFNLNHLRAVA